MYRYEIAKNSLHKQHNELQWLAIAASPYSQLRNGFEQPHPPYMA